MAQNMAEIRFRPYAKAWRTSNREVYGFIPNFGTITYRPSGRIGVISRSSQLVAA